MRRAMTMYALTGAGIAIAAVAYSLGRADREAGVHRSWVPSVYAADANTYVGLEPGTLLPQDQEVIPGKRLG